MAIVETLEIKDKNVAATLDNVITRVKSLETALKRNKSETSSFVDAFAKITTGANQFLELGKKGFEWTKWVAELGVHFATVRKELDDFRSFDGFERLGGTFDDIESSIGALRITAIRAGEVFVEKWGGDVAKALNDILAISIGLLKQWIQTGQSGMSAFAAVDDVIAGLIRNLSFGLAGAINGVNTSIALLLEKMATASEAVGMEDTAKGLRFAADAMIAPAIMLGNAINDALTPDNGVFEQWAIKLDWMAKTAGVSIDEIKNKVHALQHDIQKSPFVDIEAFQRSTAAIQKHLDDLDLSSLEWSLFEASQAFWVPFQKGVDETVKDVDDLAKQMKAAYKDAFVTQPLTKAVGAVSAVQSGSLEQVGALAGPIGSAIGSALELASDPEALQKGITDLGKALGAAIGNLPIVLPKAIVDGILEAFKAIWEGIKQFFKDLFNPIKFGDGEVARTVQSSILGDDWTANTSMGADSSWIPDATARTRGIQGRRRNRNGGNVSIAMSSPITDPRAVDRVFREMNRALGTRGRGWAWEA